MSMNPVMVTLTVFNIIEETLEAVDLDELEKAYNALVKLDKTDEQAIKEIAADFDDAFDWDDALARAGVIGAMIGQVAEMLDGPIWEAAIRRRLRRMGKGKRVANVGKIMGRIRARIPEKPSPR